MEITNNSRYYNIPLIVGRRIAQIVFFDSDGTVNGGSYVDSGKYQTTSDLQQLIANWQPSDCLPKMYKDREIKNGPAVDPLADRRLISNPPSEESTSIPTPNV